MIGRLCILWFLVALWPGLGLAQSPALKDAYDNYLSRYQQGHYAEAEPYARKALELGKQEFGADHPTTATLFANLGDLYRAQGRYPEAGLLHKRALMIREDVLGATHAEVGGSLNSLALVYAAQGRFDQAEPLYKRSLEVKEAA